MKSMIVSCFEDGHIEHTLKDEVYRPFADQRRSVQRMTDIRFDEDTQEFYIYWLLGPKAGQHHKDSLGNIVYYPSYQAAVTAEIELIDAMRRHGVSLK